MKFGFEEKVAVGLYVVCLLLVLVGSVVTGQNAYPYRGNLTPNDLQATPVSTQ